MTKGMEKSAPPKGEVSPEANRRDVRFSNPQKIFFKLKQFSLQTESAKIDFKVI
jgi:hypothetical protein